MVDRIGRFSEYECYAVHSAEVDFLRVKNGGLNWPNYQISMSSIAAFSPNYSKMKWAEKASCQFVVSPSVYSANKSTAQFCKEGSQFFLE